MQLFFIKTNMLAIRLNLPGPLGPAIYLPENKTMNIIFYNLYGAKTAAPKRKRLKGSAKAQSVSNLNQPCLNCGQLRVFNSRN